MITCRRFNLWLTISGNLNSKGSSRPSSFSVEARVKRSMVGPESARITLQSIRCVAKQEATPHTAQCPKWHCRKASPQDGTKLAFQCSEQC